MRFPSILLSVLPSVLALPALAQAPAPASQATAVRWTIQEGPSGGAITAGGLYTAPQGQGTFHVTTTSVADPTRTATATVSVAAASACMGTPLLAALGRASLMVGFADVDATAAQASWDLRYQYIASAIGYASSCSTVNGGWWGCWQDWSQPPGQFVKGFIATAGSNGEIPMLTYYVMLPGSGASEGSAEVSAANDATFMAKYFTDWRFLLTTIGASQVLLHLEPDFWAYAQQRNADAHRVPAAVASANPTDCAGTENSIAGMGQCMVDMVRRYAPNARVGFHASAWSSGVDVSLNTSASLDVAAEARKTATFLAACGAASTDFVVVEASDRDAGYYASIGRNTWWDAQDGRLPSFAQVLAWNRALAEALQKPLLWWQVPLGNMSQGNTTDHWQDNRVQYFFDHPDRFAAAHVVGIAFGAGAGGQTTPSTDGGYLVSRARSYSSAGGTPACP